MLGPRLAYASPAGGVVAAAPVGFVASTGSTGTGRLIVTLPGGDATWVSLTVGADGQLCEVRNADALATLTLSQSGFLGLAALILPPGARALIYYDSTDVSWELTAP